MASFHLGQLVRIVRHRFQRCRHLDGITGRVSALGPFAPIDEFDFPSDYEVLCDDGVTGRYTGDQLEPVVPDGHRPAELTVEELLPFLRDKETVK